jgi:hypothetical protein
MFARFMHNVLAPKNNLCWLDHFDEKQYPIRWTGVFTKYVRDQVLERTDVGLLLPR